MRLGAFKLGKRKLPRTVVPSGCWAVENQRMSKPATLRSAWLINTGMHIYKPLTVGASAH